MTITELPDLTFFCELDAIPLQALFADKALLADLQAMGAGVSMGMRDLSETRANVVRRLNEAGIPLIAWLLLPEEEGYWFNLNNVAQAVARYDAFRAWSEAHALHWEGVGLDIEPDMREIRQLLRGDRSVIWRVARRMLDKKALYSVRTRYAALASRIRADGYRVESYHIPLVVDERAVGSQWLRRLLGVLDVTVDREVLMLYSSFLRPHGAAVLWSYAPEAGAIAVGSTGGGVTIGGADRIPPLSWEELRRDLLLAHRWSDALYIFSLEGCVDKGYLPRLREFDWSAPVEPPLSTLRNIERARSALRAILWAGAHPGTLVAAIVTLWWLTSRLRHRADEKQQQHPKMRV